MKIVAVITALTFLFVCRPRNVEILESRTIPLQTRQVLLIRTGSWNASRGILYACRRTGLQWRKEMHFDVSIGKNGLGWGPGFGGEGPEKHEGDGRSPAGMWRIGGVFGAALSPPPGLRMDYRCITERDYFIDDPDSPLYNQWLSIPDSLPNTPEAYAGSFERMMRDDGIYELGLVVEYNMDPVIPGRGSAIFMHQWRSKFSPTIGCTAMSRENLIRLVQWLRPDHNPMIIQLVEGAVIRRSRSDRQIN